MRPTQNAKKARTPGKLERRKANMPEKPEWLKSRNNWKAGTNQENWYDRREWSQRQNIYKTSHPHLASGGDAGWIRRVEKKPFRIRRFVRISFKIAISQICGLIKTMGHMWWGDTYISVFKKVEQIWILNSRRYQKCIFGKWCNSSFLTLGFRFK